MKSREKVPVFISSKCDNDEDRKNGNIKYGTMRKALKLLLEETGMCDVYAYEEGTATTTDVVHSYMDKLDASNLIIIIIDNKDGVSGGTMKEIARAKALDKKCIYIFCDEREKEPTDVQKELLKSLKNPRFYTVHDFTEIAKKVYESVIADIISIYNNFCRGIIDYRDEDLVQDALKHNSGVEIQLAPDTDLTKDFIAGFNYTKYIVKKAAGVAFGEFDNPSEQDENCAMLLNIIIGEHNKGIASFAAIKEDIKTYHKGNVLKLVLLRYEAIELYFGGKVAACVNKLNECIEFCESCKNIPKWLYNDVALDLRNIQVDLDKEKDIINYNSKGQELLNKDKEPLYYPVIDRIISDHNSTIYKYLMRNTTQSPYTVNIGGVDYSLDKVCDAFIVAYSYGSLTHMLLIRKKLYEYLIAVSLEIRDHRMFMFCVKLLVLANERKDFQNYLKAYGENTNNINSQDIKKLLDAVNKQPVKLSRITNRALLMQHFGYYYSDADFKSEYTSLIQEVKACITKKYGLTTVVKPILDLFYDIRYRISEIDIMEFVYFLFENSIRLYYDDAFKLLQYLQLKDIPKEKQKEYQKFIIDCFQDKDIRECNYLKIAAQSLRQCEDIEHKGLDNCVKKWYPKFFEDTYVLNTTELDDSLGWKYVARQIESINSDNANQGKNGTYYGNAFDPYKTIERIIAKTEMKLNSTQMKQLVSAVRGTLFADTQTVDAKVRAMELLSAIQLLQRRNKQIRQLADDMISKKDIVLNAKTLYLEKGYSTTLLHFCFSLLQAILNDCYESELSRTLTRLQNEEVAVQITAFRIIERLSELGLLDICSDKASSLLFYHTIGNSYNDNHDVQFYAMSALTKMRKGNYKEECYDRFIEMMDYEPYLIKVGLLYRIKDDDKSDSKVKFIFEKGKNDSHYWIRYVSSQAISGE